MLFLIENMKSNPALWESKNEIMAHKSIFERPGLKIYQEMVNLREKIFKEIFIHLTADQNKDVFPNYVKMDADFLTDRINIILELLELSVLTGDRIHIISYARHIARKRIKENISFDELASALNVAAEIIKEILLARPKLWKLRQKIHDEIILAAQMVIDEIEDVYELANIRQIPKDPDIADW